MKRKLLFIHLLFTGLLAVVFSSCSKQVETADMPGSKEVSGFHISASKITLLQGNANSYAVTFKWTPAGAYSKYTIEADISGSDFEEPMELGSTSSNTISFTVQDLNNKICRLLYANQTGNVDFRVRAENGKGVSVYSGRTAVTITTYKEFREYEDANTIKIPGNFQGWNLTTASKIVDADKSGEYEGFVNFPNEYPQILLVKGSQWQKQTTFTYIGADKFGFGGTVLSVFGGSGPYLIRASTNTNKWSYTKIDSWSLFGDAVNNTQTDRKMSADEEGLSWSITTNLSKGSFRIRANNSNAISFGNKACSEAGVPSFDGDNIVIKKAGSYTVKLSLGLAGNYAYSIQKNN